MPKMFKKQKKKQDLLDDLPNIFRTVMKQHGLSFGDFPDMDLFRKSVESLDFEKFPKLKGNRMNQGRRMVDLNKMLKNSIPDMLNRLVSAFCRRFFCKTAGTFWFHQYHDCIRRPFVTHNFHSFVFM